VLHRRKSPAMDRIGEVLFMEAEAMPEAKDYVEGAAPSATTSN